MSRLSNTFSFFPSAALFWCLALPTPVSSGHAITIFHVSCHATPNVSLNPSAVSDIDAPGRVCLEDKHRPSAPLTNEAHLSLQLSVDPLHSSVAWMCNVKPFFFFLQTIHNYQPQFVALHFQEVGGKDYRANMSHAEDFFRLAQRTFHN